jgi:hypothetical protein
VTQWGAIQAAVAADGEPYGTPGALLPAAEADLASPFAVPWAKALSAMVQFAPQGPVQAVNAYVVLQGSNDGGVTWFDIAWCSTTQAVGQDNYLISAGSDGTNNVVRQTRALGTSPGTGSNAGVLPGLLRFVGKGSVGQSSSSSSSSGAGVAPGVAVTIRYRLLGLR